LIYGTEDGILLMISS